jgi:hypothetical protein
MFDDHRVMPLSIFSALSVDIFKFKRNSQNLKIIVSNLYVKQWYVSEQLLRSVMIWKWLPGFLYQVEGEGKRAR